MRTRTPLRAIGTFLLVCSLLCPLGSQAQAPAPDPRVAVLTYLDRMEAFGFAGGVGVIFEGETMFARGLGYAYLETSQDFTPETGFFIASVSKQFTAALILALEDRGLLNTEHSIGTYVDDVPPGMASVTIHHLLSHTSGLLRLEGDSEHLADGEAVLAAGLRAGLEYEPGSRFDYSNAGYAFLAALAERVGRKSYEALTREFLFEPAGMDATSVVTEAAFWEDRPLSTGYNGFLPQGTAVLDRPYGRELIGPAGIVTTIDDMLRWEVALQEGVVLSDARSRKFFTPVLDNYAYGWSVWESQLAGERVAGHDGHIMPEGFNCYYIRLLDSKTAVIVFASRGDVALAERLAWALVTILQGKASPEVPEVGPSTRTPQPGRYTAVDGAGIRVHRAGDQLSVEPLNQAAANLFLEDTVAATRATSLVERLLRSGEGDGAGALAGTIAAAEAQSSWYGAYGGQEVVYSVQEDGFVRTHLRHFLGTDTLYTRLDLIEGEVVGGTDEAAFISGGRGLTPTLAYLGMAPARGREWTVYDFWGQRGVTVTVEERALAVHSGDRVVRLRAESP